MPFGVTVILTPGANLKLFLTLKPTFQLLPRSCLANSRQDVRPDHDHSHAFPSPSLSRSYGSDPVTRTGPVYLGPSPEPPRQS
jgi:hypothetical protein